ncbi:unnamed protein product [Ectocarpus sp. 8 AP-2014]
MTRSSWWKNSEDRLHIADGRTLGFAFCFFSRLAWDSPCGRNDASACVYITRSELRFLSSSQTDRNFEIPSFHRDSRSRPRRVLNLYGHTKVLGRERSERFFYVKTTTTTTTTGIECAHPRPDTGRKQ